MKKVLFILLIFSFSINAFYGQLSRTEKKEYNEAKEMLAEEKYKDAKDIFSKYYKKDSNNLEYNFYNGICELNTENFDAAIENFDFIINNYEQTKEESEFTRSSYFYKAQAYHNLYMFDEELDVLTKISDFDLKDDEKEQLRKLIIDVNEAKEIFFDFKPIIVTRLDILNSDFDDHTPIPTAEGEKLYFTSKRPGGISGKELSDEGKYYEDIWMWETDKEPINIGLPINTGKHDATGGLSFDGNTIFIYRASDKKLGDIYTSNLIDGKWTEPKKLNKNINKRKTIERHATLSIDGKTLFFSSDRSGGKGGRDIWKSELQEDNTWGEPVNLEINTEFDEESPFLLADGKTFYFSSKGYKGMGGYDIFKCTLTDSGFSQVENIGFPVNTVEDDVFFFPLSDEETAFFTRRRTNNAEIYKTIFPNNTFIIESYVTGKEFDTTMTVLDYPMLADIDILGINTNDEPEEYTIKLSKGVYKTVLIPDKDIKFYYTEEGYVFDTENISVNETVGQDILKKEPVLIKIQEGKTEKNKLTPFEEGSYDLNDYTKTELDLIAENLEKYPQLYVNFSTENYTEETDSLSKQRKNKAVDYLISKGISSERILTDLSDREIPENFLEYTIFDNVSIQDVIADKEEKIKVDSIFEEEFYVVEIENVFFKFDKSNLVTVPEEKLKVLSDYLKNNPDAKIAVIGYTDAVGSKAYNDKLALRRANLVKSLLIKKGAKDSQIKTLAYGEDNPVTFNMKNGKYYEPSKQYNRRVEFMVIIQGDPKLKVLQFKNVPVEYKDPNYDPKYKR